MEQLPLESCSTLIATISHQRCSSAGSCPGPQRCPFLLPYNAPPLGFFWLHLRQNQATRPALEPNWASGPDAKCCHTPSRHLPGSPQQRPPFHTPLSFAYYAITIMEVDDDGTEIILHNHPDSGCQCRGSERGIGGVGRHSGREDWPQSDRHSLQKNHGEFGGDTTITNCTVVIAGGFSIFSLFKLSYSNIFECSRNGVNDNTRQMLPKWIATTSHIFYILWLKQSSSSHIVNKHEHPS